MAGSELKRTHPLAVLAGVGGVVMQGVVWLFIAATALPTTGDLAPLRLVLVPLAVLTIPAGAILVWMRWARFGYGIVAHDLIIDEGVFVRRRRSIPIARIQSVDVRADIVSRLLGLAHVSVQTAGGSAQTAEASIGPIGRVEAEVLRGRLSAGVATAPIRQMADTAPPTHTATGDTLEPTFTHAVAPGRILAFAATSTAPTLIAIVAALLLSAGAVLLIPGMPLAALVGMGGLLTLVVSAAVTAIAASTMAIVAGIWDFSVRRTGGRIETHCGLLERRSTGIPVGRIQALMIDSTPIQRLLGYVSVRVQTAGASIPVQQGVQPTTLLLPLVTNKEVHSLLAALLPEGARFARTAPLPSRSLRFYLTWPLMRSSVLLLSLAVPLLAGSLVLELPDEITALVPLTVALMFLCTLASVAAAEGLAWRHAAYGADARALVVEYGLLARHRVRLSRTRIQWLAVRQSPFQKRAGLATLVASSVSGSGEALHAIRHVPVRDAARIERWYSPDAPNTPVEPDALNEPGGE
jgi:putative membrane protein